MVGQLMSTSLRLGRRRTCSAVIVDRVGFDVGAERDLVDGRIRRLVVVGVTCCKDGDGSALVGDEDDGAGRGGGVVHVVGFGGGDGACWIGRCPDECASTPRIAPASYAGPAGMSLPRSLCRAQTMQPTSSRRTWARLGR